MSVMFAVRHGAGMENLNGRSLNILEHVSRPFPTLSVEGAILTPS